MRPSSNFHISNALAPETKIHLLKPYGGLLGCTHKGRVCCHTRTKYDCIPTHTHKVCVHHTQSMRALSHTPKACVAGHTRTKYACNPTYPQRCACIAIHTHSKRALPLKEHKHRHNHHKSRVIMMHSCSSNIDTAEQGSGEQWAPPRAPHGSGTQIFASHSSLRKRARLAHSMWQQRCMDSACSFKHARACALQFFFLRVQLCFTSSIASCNATHVRMACPPLCCCPVHKVHEGILNTLSTWISSVSSKTCTAGGGGVSAAAGKEYESGAPDS